MLARSFGYDFETDSWIEYTSHSMIHDEIEAIPYRIWALGYYDWEPQIYWEVACISDMTHALFCVEQYFSDERRLKNLTPQLYIAHDMTPSKKSPGMKKTTR